MYSQIAANKRKTVVIMFAFVLFVGLIGLIFSEWQSGSPALTPYVLLGALIYAVISYYSGSRLSLAVNGAQEITKRDNPRLFRVVENIAITDGLPTPKVYIINDPAPNAFATGRNPNTSSVCVTNGLLEIMDDKELEGVIAHEMGHVKNYDIRVSMVAFAMVAVIAILADVMIRMTWFGGGRRNNSDGEGNQIFFLLGILAAILAPVIATMIQLAISRQREYLADATGALTTRYPEGLVSALAKIEKTGSALKRQNTATAHFFFANPLKGHSITNLFSTHPPIPDRIKRLQEMGSRA
ncbi:MAG: zinc metalloprotease HtpX [Candidatus Saccharimonadales bacterium]